LGSEVLKINNMPPLKYLEQNQIPYTSGNTLHSRLNIARKNMTYGKSNDSIKIEIKKTNNQVKELVLKYEGKKELNSMDDMTFTAFSVFNRTNVNTLSDKLEQNHILYLRYDGFDRRDGIVDELRQKINNDISYIILDLRNNRGGDESVADSLLMCLVDIDTLFTYRSITRTSNAFYAAMGYGYPQYNDYYEGLALDTLPEETYIKGDLPLFNQPLFVLISEETCSAAEDFLIALKLHFPQRAILVGVPTAGSTGAPFVRNLEKKRMYYRICTRFPLLPEGMFENGIQPDYYYEKNLDEYLTGEDKIFQYVDKIKKNKEK
jgi:C-terminal processing protease CtpA/Prc